MKDFTENLHNTKVVINVAQVAIQEEVYWCI